VRPMTTLPSLATRLPQTRLAIGLDVGGTKIAGGVVTSAGEILERIVVPTPSVDDETNTLVVLRRVIDELRGRHPQVEAIGVGAAGMVEWPAGYIRWAPNNAYRALPLRKLLEEATRLPTIVENDANVAAWAESRFGSGAGYDDIVCLTVGTGIGGGLILGGRLYRGKAGIGAEVGHIIVNPEGRSCGCGNNGCLEALAAGPALGAYGREAAQTDPDGYLAKLAGGSANVTGETVFAAACDGDPTARSLFEQLGYWLGIGIASLVTLFNLELVVIGGGLGTTGELLLAPARASFERFVFARSQRQLPSIVPARLGVEAGLIGAAALALDHQDIPKVTFASETRDQAVVVATTAAEGEVSVRS
jgi:glucokinase